MEEMALVKRQLVSVSDKLQAWFSRVAAVQEIIKIVCRLLKGLGVHFLITLESFRTDERHYISKWDEGTIRVDPFEGAKPCPRCGELKG